MSPKASINVRRIAIPGMLEPPGATWSNCLVVGREVVMSGVTARGADGRAIGGDDAALQARAIFERLGAILADAGGGMRNIYKLVIYVTDAAFKDDVNAARAAAFERVFPASTFVVVSGFAFPGLHVEIDACANLDVDLHAAETAA